MAVSENLKDPTYCVATCTFDCASCTNVVFSLFTDWCNICCNDCGIFGIDPICLVRRRLKEINSSFIKNLKSFIDLVIIDDLEESQHDSKEILQGNFLHTVHRYISNNEETLRIVPLNTTNLDVPSDDCDFYTDHNIDFDLQLKYHHLKMVELIFSTEVD